MSLNRKSLAADHALEAHFNLNDEEAEPKALLRSTKLIMLFIMFMLGSFALISFFYAEVSIKQDKTPRNPTASDTFGPCDLGSTFEGEALNGDFKNTVQPSTKFTLLQSFVETSKIRNLGESSAGADASTEGMDKSAQPPSAPYEPRPSVLASSTKHGVRNVYSRNPVHSFAKVTPPSPSVTPAPASTRNIGCASEHVAVLLSEACQQDGTLSSHTFSYETIKHEDSRLNSEDLAPPEEVGRMATPFIGHMMTPAAELDDSVQASAEPTAMPFVAYIMTPPPMVKCTGLEDTLVGSTIDTEAVASVEYPQMGTSEFVLETVRPSPSSTSIHFVVSAEWQAPPQATSQSPFPYVTVSSHSAEGVSLQYGQLSVTVKVFTDSSFKPQPVERTVNAEAYKAVAFERLAAQMVEIIATVDTSTAVTPDAIIDRQTNSDMMTSVSVSVSIQVLETTFPEALQSQVSKVVSESPSIESVASHEHGLSAESEQSNPNFSAETTTKLQFETQVAGPSKGSIQDSPLVSQLGEIRDEFSAHALSAQHPPETWQQLVRTQDNPVPTVDFSGIPGLLRTSSSVMNKAGNTSGLNGLAWTSQGGSIRGDFSIATRLSWVRGCVHEGAKKLGGYLRRKLYAWVQAKREYVVSVMATKVIHDETWGNILGRVNLKAVAMLTLGSVYISMIPACHNFNPPHQW